MRHYKLAGMVVALGILAAPALAQEERETERKVQTKEKVTERTRTAEVRTDQDRGELTGVYMAWFKPATRWQKASDLIGKNVKNNQDENLGEIKNLAIDLEPGRVIYAVLSFGGVAGIGDKNFAVPLTALKLSDDFKHFVLNVGKDQLKNAEGFDPKGQWPNMADMRWATSTHQFYKADPYWRESDTQPGSPFRFTGMWQKATDLIGKPVKNRQNENLGELHDMAIDPDNGRVIAGILAFGGVAGVGEKLFAVPWGSLDMQPDAKHFVLDIDRERLKNAPSFARNNWPDFASQTTVREYYVFYREPLYWERTGRVEGEMERRDDDLKDKDDKKRDKDGGG